MRERDADRAAARDHCAAGPEQPRARIGKRGQHAFLEQVRGEDLGDDQVDRAAERGRVDLPGMLPEHLDAVGEAVGGDDLLGGVGDREVGLAAEHLAGARARGDHREQPGARADVEHAHAGSDRALDRVAPGDVARGFADHPHMPVGNAAVEGVGGHRGDFRIRGGERERFARERISALERLLARGHARERGEFAGVAARGGGQAFPGFLGQGFVARRPSAL